MYNYRAELAEINARCDALGITGELLSKTDVGRIIGRTPRTVGKYLQFGGTVTLPVLSRAQLARQIAELTRYQAQRRTLWKRSTF